MNIEIGELITLSNNKEYICSSVKEEDGKRYLFLISNFKPLEIKIGEQIIIDGKLNVKIINDNLEKQRLLELFEIL